MDVLTLEEDNKKENIKKTVEALPNKYSKKACSKKTVYAMNTEEDSKEAISENVEAL